MSLASKALGWMVGLICAMVMSAGAGRAETYTVSGYTFDRPHNTGTGERENREVRRVERESADPPERTEPSADEIAEERERAARARAAHLQAVELQRVKSNEEIIGERLRELASRPAVAPPPIVLHMPADPMMVARTRSVAAAMESPEHRVPALRQQAREEWYWFTVNHIDLMWGAIGAGLDPSPNQPPLDDTFREAREHLTKYLELVETIESITHTHEYAERRYQERMRWLTIQRGSAYNVNKGNTTAMTDIYPPRDGFEPWSEDEIIRGQPKPCKFDASGYCR